MEGKKCRECVHYRQHYGIDSKKIFRVYCGHCTQGRRPTRKPDHIACENFEPAYNENDFVSKEYLSKELLRYVLEMDLLPEILNAATEQWKIGGK